MREGFNFGKEEDGRFWSEREREDFIFGKEEDGRF